MHPFLIFAIGLIVVVGCILLLRLHAFLALLLGTLAVALLTPAEALEAFTVAQGMSGPAATTFLGQSIGARITDGFGRTAGQIGIVIAMASAIGICLLESGAAERIVRAALNLFGERRVDAALLGSGFFLAIPVFFDTVFFLMIPIAQSLYQKTKKNYLLYVLVIIAGGIMAHSLVPPTPGPLFIADAFNVSIATMAFGGCIVGLIAAGAGYLFARWANKTWPLDLTDLPAPPAQDTPLPGLLPSLLPILLPIALITAGAALRTSAFSSDVLQFMSDKNIALITGALLAMGLLWRRRGQQEAADAMKRAIKSAGVIILITGIGGAFGKILQQTNIAAHLESMVVSSEAAILPIAFLLTALIRTAQGSATVSMITAAGAFAGLASASTLGFHPVFLALAIGCGSKPIWWMNDSGFWVVTQMGRLSEKEALRTLAPISTLMGIVGLIAVMIGAALFKM